jgi:hypothetical protein
VLFDQLVTLGINISKDKFMTLLCSFLDSYENLEMSLRNTKMPRLNDFIKCLQLYANYKVDFKYLILLLLVT